MKKFVIKLVLIFGGLAVLIACAVVFFFWQWSRNIGATMPEEGKAIFARIDPERCSLGICAACTAEQCPEAEGQCQIREYKWITQDKGYFRPYCDALTAPTLPPPAPSSLPSPKR